MATPQIPADVLQKFRDVNAKNYQDQAIFYLNAFWTEGAEAQAEEVWTLWEAFAKEDHVKGKEGNELNPIQAFNLLQKQNKTLTALELKALLRKVDYDANGEMSLAEYLVGFNNRCPKAFVNNPQGAIDPVKLAALEARMAELDAQLQDLQSKEAAAVAAEAEAKSREAAAIQQEKTAREAQKNAEDASEAAKKAAAAVKAIEDEARAIADEIKREEDAKAAEIARLEALSTDQSVGIVKRNMAVQQLASAKGEDPLPLRKAKLTQDAVVRRLAKATAAADEEAQKAAAAAVVAKEAADDATAARQAAEEARAAAVVAVEEVKKALQLCQDSIAEVLEELETMKKSSGNPQGLLWWQQRVVQEKKKSLPQRMW